MESKETLNKNEITIIYDYNKSKDIIIEDRERVQKELGESISREKLFGERFVKNNKNKCDYKWEKGRDMLLFTKL